MIMSKKGAGYTTNYYCGSTTTAIVSILFFLALVATIFTLHFTATLLFWGWNDTNDRSSSSPSINGDDAAGAIAPPVHLLKKKTTNLYHRYNDNIGPGKQHNRGSKHRYPGNSTTVTRRSSAVIDGTGTTTTPSKNDTNNCFGGIVARAFFAPTARKNNHSSSFPCFRPEAKWRLQSVQNTPTRVGFFFLKPYKTASSTVSGIHLRIARNVAARRQQQQLERQRRTRRQQQLQPPPNIEQQQQPTFDNGTSSSGYEICKSRFDHGPYHYPANHLFGNRRREKSFLWTVLRDPTKRLTSLFFHMEVSRKKLEPTDANFQAFLRQHFTEMDPGYYVRNLSVRKRIRPTRDNPVDYANWILEDYDFIGITERLDESVVVLMMLLKLRMADILFVNAKSSGSYDDKCIYIWPSFVSPGMREYFDTDPQYERHVRYDLDLYRAANRSLDMTIDALGRGKFRRKLEQYRRIMAEEIQTRCLPAAQFPCSQRGGPKRLSSDCLWIDSGCGTACLDNVSTQLQLW